MAVFLVDYENVQGKGLWGVEVLAPEDVLYIFYSAACPNISRRDANLIDRSGCEFHAVYLPHTGHNALDFMIVAQLGILAERGYKNIAVISMDQGFLVAKEYIMSTLNNMNVVVAKSIESGIRKLPAEPGIGGDRRCECIQGAERIGLRTFGDAHLKKAAIKDLIEGLFGETPYSDKIDELCRYVKDCAGMKSGNDRYRSALKLFGGKDGLNIYQRLKPMIDEAVAEREPSPAPQPQNTPSSAPEQPEAVPAAPEEETDKCRQLLMAALEKSHVTYSLDMLYNLTMELLRINSKDARYKRILARFGTVEGQLIYKLLKPVLTKFS